MNGKLAGDLHLWFENSVDSVKGGLGGQPCEHLLEAAALGPVPSTPSPQHPALRHASLQPWFCFPS
jgi:hypothetical protein